MITAVVLADELHATAAGSSAGGTRNGAKDCAAGAVKPRAAPNTTSTT